MEYFNWIWSGDHQMNLLFWVITAILILLFGILWRVSQKVAIWYPPLVMAPAAGGVLVGYTVGLSETPIVATFIPLLFGLLGAVGYAEARNRNFQSQFVKGLDGLESELSGESLAKLKDLANASGPEQGYVPALAGLGTCCFFIFCFLGVGQGIEQRVPSYNAMDALLYANPPLTPDEVMAIANTAWALRLREIPVDEHDRILSFILKPALEKEEGREQELIRIAKLMRKNFDEDVPITIVPGPPSGGSAFLKSAAAENAIAGIQIQIDSNALEYKEAYAKLKQVILDDLTTLARDASGVSNVRTIIKRISESDKQLLSGEKTPEDFKVAYLGLKSEIENASKM